MLGGSSVLETSSVPDEEPDLPPPRIFDPTSRPTRALADERIIAFILRFLEVNIRAAADGEPAAVAWMGSDSRHIDAHGISFLGACDAIGADGDGIRRQVAHRKLVPAAYGFATDDP